LHNNAIEKKLAYSTAATVASQHREFINIAAYQYTWHIYKTSTLAFFSRSTYSGPTHGDFKLKLDSRYL
jgi:hypothetical protein